MQAYETGKIVFDLVEQLVASNPDRDVVLVSGACRLGADNFAAEASKLYNITIKEFPVPPGEYTQRWQYSPGGVRQEQARGRRRRRWIRSRGIRQEGRDRGYCPPLPRPQEENLSGRWHGTNLPILNGGEERL